MPWSQDLRGFITERLTAAAEEIFTHVERIVAAYDEELGRQSKLLEVVCKPRVKLQRIELPQQHVCEEEEVLTEQQLWNQERSSSLDREEPESLQIKEEQEQICTSHEGEQLEVKQEADALMLTPNNEGSDDMEPEPDSDQQLLSHSSAEAESQDQTGSNHVDSVSDRNANPLKRSDGNNVDNCHISKTESESLTSKRYFQCDTCGKVFDYKSQLILHMRVHTGVKPYSCEACGKCFAQGHSLIIHERLHTDEKPYSCKTCGKCFAQRPHLLYHERTHTGEKPYHCSTCGKSFSRRSNFKRHLRIHFTSHKKA